MTFSSNREAEASINSADAVLGNRFIKMFYHYDKSNSGGGPMTQRTPVKDRLGPATGVTTPGSGDLKSPGTGGDQDSGKVKFEGHQLTKTIANPSPKTEEERKELLAKKLEEKELVGIIYLYQFEFHIFLSDLAIRNRLYQLIFKKSFREETL